MKELNKVLSSEAERLNVANPGLPDPASLAGSVTELMKRNLNELSGDMGQLEVKRSASDFYANTIEGVANADMALNHVKDHKLPRAAEEASGALKQFGLNVPSSLLVNEGSKVIDMVQKELASDHLIEDGRKSMSDLTHEIYGIDLPELK